MANITTRSLATDGTTVSSSVFNKGSALTISEMDSNFLNLNNEKIDILNPSLTGILTLSGTSSGAVGSIDLLEASTNGTNKITIKAPLSCPDLTLQLPADAGSSGYALVTNGSGVLSWSATAGDITEIVAGTGLTGDATSGVATLNVVGGTGITANANDIAIDTGTTVDLATAQTLTNKTLTSPKINEDVAVTSTATELNLLDGVSGLVQADLTKLAAIDSTATELNLLDGITAIDADLTSVAGTDTTLASAKAVKAYVDAQTHEAALSLIDEDNMATDSATRPPSQQSVKAYVDGQTHTGEANEYSFKTIEVSGQTSVVADADDDTLTLVAGSNMTITTSADEITLAATDTGSTTLAALTDTTITSAADAALLLYDQGTNTWRDGAMSGDATITDTGALTIASGAVEHGMLSDNIVSGQAEITSGLTDADDELMYSDDGVIKRVSVSTFLNHSDGRATTLQNKTLTSPSISGTLSVASNGDLIVDTEGSYTFRAGLSTVTWTLNAAKSLADGETLTQATSGATAVVRGATSSSTSVVVSDITGTPTTTSGHTLTGSVSGALSTYIANLNLYYGNNAWTSNDSVKFLQHSIPGGDYSIEEGDWGVRSAPFHFQGAMSINGTTTPSTNLLYNTGLQIESSNTGWPSITLKSESATANDRFGNVWFVRSGSNSTDAYVVDDDKLGGFYASGYHEGDGHYNNTSAAFYFKADGDHTATNLGGYMRFEATPNGSESKVAVVHMKGGLVEINPADTDVDFKVNGDSVANAIKVDAGTDTLSSACVKVSLPNLPTSDPGVAGQLWNNSNVLNISAG